MNEFLKLIPNIIFACSAITMVVVVYSQNHLIDDLLGDISILNHNQKVLQMEIDSMTNSSQIIDGYNMTSGKCAKGFNQQLGVGGMYHCEREKTI